MIELRVLGAFDVRTDRPDGPPGGITQPKRLALLLYLALSRPYGLHARDQLLALLWPDADDASSRHSLRNALHALRQALGDEAVTTRGDSYVGLDLALFHCDVHELRAHLAAGRLDDAVALWKGDLAPGFHVSGAPDFERWLDEERMELRRDVRAAAWKRTHELAGTGQAEIDAVRRALQLDPGNEPGARRLMRLLDAAGDRGGALRAYREISDFFARELDTQPSSETTALAAELRAAPVPTRPTPAPPAWQPVVMDSPVAATTPSVSAPVRRPLVGVAVIVGALATLALGAREYSPHRDDVATPRARTAVAAADEAERAILRLPARYRADTSAYRSYLRGLTLRFQFRFPESRDTFASLVDREPLYVPGLYGLAHAYILTTLNDLTGAEESWPKIDALARQALALDSTAASAWLALAAADMFYQPNLTRAGERIAHAQRLDSLEPDAAGMQSVWYRFHGEMDSAVAAAQRAHRLDPLSGFFARLVGKQLYFARRYEESRVVYARMLRDDPGWKRGYIDFFQLNRAMGRPRDAVEWLRRAAAASGDSARAAALTIPATDAEARQLLAADARRVIAQLDKATQAGAFVPPSRYAEAFAALGDTEATLKWLDAMVADHDTYVAQVRVDPVFDFVRTDPRYHAWEERSGLPPLAPASIAQRTPPARLPS